MIKIPAAVSAALTNNGERHYNHSPFSFFSLPLFYRLENGVPVHEPDFFSWWEWIVTSFTQCQIATTRIGKRALVETFFAGVDFSLGVGELKLYQTKVSESHSASRNPSGQGGELVTWKYYRTFEEAFFGHLEIVRRLEARYDGANSCILFLYLKGKWLKTKIAEVKKHLRLSWFLWRAIRSRNH